MKIKALPPPAPPPPKPIPTAAYARVSSGKEAMLHSLSAQVSYYSELIGKNPRWAYAGVYSDEAMTGTKAERPGFQQMLDECRAGNIRQIITKSISRFARNTVTVLESVRELKALGVDVFFEEQGIHSLSAEGELMLTILSSFAQEESLSVSENCKWRIRKDFREGRISGMKMLGYHVINGRLVIIPEEAELVRAIFDNYLSGMGVLGIVKKYRAQGVQLSETGIWKMLRNEKYQGDLLLQKTFRENHITKRQICNAGQLPKYYVTSSHEGIISREQFATVQAEIARRAAHHKGKTQPVPRSPFTSIIRCGQCGAAYRHKIAGSAPQYKKPVWICGTFNSLGKAECDSQQIPEEILLAKTQEAGGFDGLEQILVTGHGALSFIYKGARRVELTWQNPSRSHSWTPEMREAARQKALKQHKGA